MARNIGIIAHINAGKTTTTERILFYAGLTRSVGDVDQGNTVTDYLAQERDRGITITSAAVTLDWKSHRINIIDTPGHIDFSIEVERSLSVLDGAVTLLDASAGVEAQTITVWNQAKKYRLPNVIYLNKMDKPQASFKMCLDDLKGDLDIRASLVQLPVKSEANKLELILDLINRRSIRWLKADENNGINFSIGCMDELDKRLLESVEERREVLVNQLADCDETFANHVIDCDKISQVSASHISEAIRRATLACKFSPVLVGSSFKYVGVQPLLNAIVDYLPSPDERRSQLMSEQFGGKRLLDNNTNDDACAFIFKIMHDKRLGALSYLKVCNGQLRRSQRLKNLHNNRGEQIKRLYRAFADELCEIERPVERDDIVIATGLQDSRTGDILVAPSWIGQTPAPSVATAGLDDDGGAQSEPHEPAGLSGERFDLLNEQIIVPRICPMEPVYFCTIEAPSAAKQLKLEEALACLAREDPSLAYEIDSLGVGTIRGMGKLHLEVVRDRIESEHKVAALLGPMQISYRETISAPSEHELQVQRVVNGVANNLTIRLLVRPKPLSGAWSARKLRLDVNNCSELVKLRREHRKAIGAGLNAAMLHGPTLGYPLIDCELTLLHFRCNHKCSAPVISSSAAQCLSEALASCAPVLLEPIMLLEVVAPLNCNGPLVADLSSARRAQLLSTQARPGANSIVIRCKAPLAKLADYSERLRILTSGRGSFSMELHNYAAMSDSDRRELARI